MTLTKTVAPSLLSTAMTKGLGVFVIWCALNLLPDHCRAQQLLNNGSRQREIVHRAIDYLWITMHGEEWKPAGGLILANANAKRQVVESLTAWLLLTNPDYRPSDRSGFESAKQRLFDRVYERIEAKSSSVPMFNCWIDGFDTFFVFEKALQDQKLQPRDRQALERLAERFLDSQNREGGWGHSGRGPTTSFYPTTLISTTNFGLLSFGACVHFKLDITNDFEFEEGLASAINMCTEVQSTGGAMPYGGPAYRKGYQSSRTAHMLIGLAALGKSKTNLFKRARIHVRKNVRNVAHGHASPALHIGMAGITFAMLGEKAWSEYSVAVLTKLPELQQRDGSFSDFAEGSPDSMILGSTRAIDDAYRTVLYAVGLCGNNSKIAITLRNQIDGRETEQSTVKRNGLVELPKMTPLKILDVGKVAGYCLSADHLATINETGQVSVVDIKNGEKLVEYSVKKREPDHQTRMHLHGDYLLLATTEVREKQQSSAEKRDPIVGAAASFLGLNEVIITTEMNCFSLSQQELRWKDTFEGMPQLWNVGGNKFRLAKSNDVVQYELKSGKRRDFISEFHRPLNNHFQTGNDGSMLVASQSELKMLDSNGEQLWAKRLRAKRGINSPAYTAIAHGNDKVYLASSDGWFGGYAANDGAKLWRIRLDSMVDSIQIATNGMVIIGTNGGLLYGFRKDAKQWSLDALSGGEQRKGYESTLSLKTFVFGSSVAVHHRDERLVKFYNVETGKLLGTVNDVDDCRSGGGRFAIRKAGQMLLYGDDTSKKRESRADFQASKKSTCILIFSSWPTTMTPVDEVSKCPQGTVRIYCLLESTRRWWEMSTGFK